MSDANLHVSSSRTGLGNGLLPNSFRAIFRSASKLASTVHSAGSTVASTVTSTDEERQCEQVQWAGFDKLELAPDNVRQVLLLSYTNGFQVWDVENADNVREVVSKRDGPVNFLRVQPQPAEKSDKELAHPLLLVITSDALNCRSKGAFINGYSATIANSSVAENLSAPTLVKFYSVRSHSYVHTLTFRTAILAVRCSPRIVAIALATQLHCFNAATLQNTLSVPTYPSPQLGSCRLSFGHGALAVGARWLAYAANQPIISTTGRVSPQHLTPSGVSPSTSLANGGLVAHYAKESSKQLAAGIVTLGDKGYKALSRYCTESVGSPVSGSSTSKGGGGHMEHAGTVIVRDFLTKVVVSQFRAHDSPLSALSFDHTGMLLVTASVHGHSINIFRLLPGSNVNGFNTSSYDTTSSHTHLYKLYRGMTNAVIQDIAFSEDSRWIAVSSSRGTHHLFAISPFGGAVGFSTHGAGRVECALGSMQSLPWWSNRGPLTSSQYFSGTLPGTVSLSVVSRIKIGNGGRCVTMSGTACSRSCSPFGAVAVAFHDGRGCKLDAGGEQNTLKEQLWVLSPSGHLIRHALHLSAATGGHSNSISSPTVAGLQKEVSDLKVLAEPLQKWDLCRRINWVEREEKVNISNVFNVAHDGATFGRSDTFSKETTNSQMRQWFLSKAEVYMHHLRLPLWESSQVSFHLLSEPALNKVHWEDDSGGESEIEKVVCGVVEVRKKDLVPAFDLLRDHQLGENISLFRDASYLPKGRLSSSNCQPGTKFGFTTDARVSQSQYSSSESSCGSEGSSCSGVNVGFSNGHHSYKECPQGLPGTTLLVHKVHQHFHEESGTLQNMHSPSFHACKCKKGVTAESVRFPSLNIPCLSHGDTDALDSKAGRKPGFNGLEVLHKRGKVSVPSDDKDAVTAGVKKELINAGCIPNGCYSHHEDLECLDSAGTRSDSGFMLSAAEEACPTLRSHAVNLDKTSESLLTSTNKDSQKYVRQDYEVATDVESTDENSKSEGSGGEQGEDDFEGIDGNSKSEDFGGEREDDFEGREHAEDGWEWTSFAFVEDC